MSIEYTMSKSKFLVLNPDPNNLESVLGKANVQNKKNGPFEAVFLLGSVLPNAEYVPETTLDAPTYFGLGKGDVNSEEGQNLNDVKSNLTLVLSPLTFFKLASGIRIAVLSADAESEKFQQEIQDKLTGAPSQTDILISYSWPYAIARQEKLSLVGSKFVDGVVEKLQPRYHFAVGNERGKFFEAKPFGWTKTDKFTRFISLGQEGSGDRWFYAFALSQNETQSTDLSPNPFYTEIPEKRPAPEEEQNQEEKVVKKAKVVGPDECFFCLSNPKAETHMIIAIGDHSYVTVAKGPLTRPTQHLSFSGHAIIIPIDHVATLRTGGEVSDSPVYQEIEKFKDSIATAFSEQKPMLRLVTFELSRSENVHHHVQLMPIPEKFEDRFEEGLREKTKMNNEKFAKNSKLEFKKFTSTEDEEYKQILNAEDYIQFELRNPKTIYIAKLEQGKQIDLQFPRRVLAWVLKSGKRTYWDKCQQPKFMEVKECDEFKEFYKQYDITKKSEDEK